MIVRIWHGWTTPENADAYQALLTSTIIPGIAARVVKGYHGMEVSRRNIDGEVEFLTVMKFDSLEDIRAFSGDDYETAVVPQAARALLSRFDARSLHYERVHSL